MGHVQWIQLNRVWFLHCTRTQNCCPVAIWACHVLTSTGSTNVCKQSKSESWSHIKLWAFCLHLSVVLDLEQYNQTLVYFCDPASVVLSYIIHLMIIRHQLEQSYNSLCVLNSQYDKSMRWDYSSGWVLQWKTVRMIDFSLCRWTEKLQTQGVFRGAGGWIYLALTFLDISSEMKNQNVF